MLPDTNRPDEFAKTAPPTFALVAAYKVAVLTAPVTLIAAVLTRVPLAVNVAPELNVAALTVPVVKTPVAFATVAVPTFALVPT